MLLYHTSDWHLGRMLYGRSLLEDQRWFLEEVFLPQAERERPACVLLSGDVYDRQVAPPEAIQLFDQALSRLLGLGIKVCVIAGNHDGAQRMALLKDVLRASGVYFATGLEDMLAPVAIEEGGQRVQVFLLPYFDSVQARDFLKDESLRGEAACMEKLLGRLLPLFEPGACHILVSHCFCAGAQTSDSESGVFVGGSGQIPAALFAPFDYVALGHLHGPQKAGQNARYSGSPLKYSVDEAGQKKGYLALSWDGEQLAAEHREATPRRDVRKIKGSFAELLAQGENAPCEDYVEISLTDQAPVMQAAERLRPCYPNLLAVRNQWALQGAAGRRSAQLRGADRAAVFSSFLREVCQMEPEEEDLALFREIMEEVGV